MKIIQVVILIVLIIVSTNIIAANEIGLTQEIYDSLCGVWNTILISDSEGQFSWGKGKNLVNGALVIDLGKDNPVFYLDGMKYRITKLSKINNRNIIVIRIYEPTYKNEYDLELSVIDKKTIIFHEMKWFERFKIFGNPDKKSNKYFLKYLKIDGPNIKFYKSRIANLRFRFEPSINSKVIRLLNKGDKLLILEKGKNDIIEKLKGNWVKVLTDKNEIGWCFDSYLES